MSSDSSKSPDAFVAASCLWKPPSPCLACGDARNGILTASYADLDHLIEPCLDGIKLDRLAKQNATCVAPDHLIKQYSDYIADLNRTNGGATFNARFGNLLGQSLFVTGFGKSWTVSGYATSAQLVAFVRTRPLLLSDCTKSLGIWYDKAVQQTVLDTCLTLPNFELTMWIARLHGQQVIFCLQEGREIPVTGPSGRSKWL